MVCSYPFKPSDVFSHFNLPFPLFPPLPLASAIYSYPLHSCFSQLASPDKCPIVTKVRQSMWFSNHLIPAKMKADSERKSKYKGDVEWGKSLGSRIYSTSPFFALHSTSVTTLIVTVLFCCTNQLKKKSFWVRQYSVSQVMYCP